jgi:hypothetical protein
MNKLALIAASLTITAGAAHAAQMTKKGYATPLAAAKHEAARRFDADASTRNNFGRLGAKDLNGTRLNKLTIKVSFSGAWAGNPTTTVRLVKKADGYHAYSAGKITIENL